ncbi:N-acetyl-1-D-myo-inositol-2-amino-2-deoxy-alpha-D-glucopyranoside deacetylase [Propionibacteriaceae bacterium Y2011]|uniref:N-acetyl-1-D-myo-inositol-2-amino-2-deoxy-alpha- D-glucopyranoside deacetylase n=1 Tax=Microlunatus sp. Y2014 TaxID=3418488 RepID=UPI003B4A0156
MTEPVKTASTPEPGTPELGRLMLVHAHPDDESSQSGATMARYAKAGHPVTLVTCTLGEEGEIIVDELSHLRSAEEDVLGEHRLQELTVAMAELGVTDFVRLGGDHRYRDSGMSYDEETQRVIPDPSATDDCFWRADLLEAATHLVELIRDRRPHVVITYNEFGGYGHPDHVQAHRVAMYGSQLAAAPAFRPDLGEPWQVSRVLWGAWAESTMREGIRMAREAGDAEFFEGIDPDGDLPPMVTPDRFIAAIVDARAHGADKVAALRAHASQVDVETGFFANLSAVDGWSMEAYVLGAGVPFDTDGPADDVFAGLGVATTPVPQSVPAPEPNPDPAHPVTA